MPIPDIGPLPDELAQAADRVIDAMIGTTAREVTATGCTLAAATEHAWGHLHADEPDVWALALLRLKETGNDEMIATITRERLQ